LQTVYNRNNTKGSENVHSEQEIEFKNLLTKAEFERFITYFELKPSDFHKQTNYYYDTADQYFKEKKMGFRLRVLPNRNELTLKIPVQDHVMEEKTKLLSNAEREAIIHHLHFPTVPFLEPLVDKGPLICIGSMQTNRAKIEMDNGILFLDHSLYSQTEDFEVEYESKDVENGQKFFLHLMKKHSIPIRYTDKKIARLVTYINSLKG